MAYFSVMTSWEVSRHPEWDMMYAAGLTVREIADLCHANVATVHLHFRVREKYTPGVHEIHAVALGKRDPDRPSTRWRQRLSEVLTFQEAHHRLPDSRAEEEEERFLARWLATQRNAYRKGRLSAAKVILLDGVKRWQVNLSQRRRDEHWRTMLEAVRIFVVSTGHMPRYRTYETEEERALGVWLHNQHQGRIENTLQPWRLAALNNAVPEWRSRA
ncbi:hypothetical protein CQ012_06425 [Arthrobacter sp. MYb214]|uniref:helicase associated domain-containing protein n=1 Tax=Arthrobacter sp. MYb214 TaxID=1848596 RepID=UPI000CFB45A7|nr:helicase associated domain-containing protein [Arthrobacter sp. MYb214]PRB76643.1 hypothetical protein CQ012_06425 [Arthrobacter sp. MYb214]